MGGAAVVIRVAFGPIEGARAAGRGDVLVVVDVLSFSTAVAAAASRGIAVHPCPSGVDPRDLAARVGGVAAVRREDVPACGCRSLSPLSYLQGPDEGTVVLASPNGATCSALAGAAAAVFAGSLVNAASAARAALALDRPITVLACGERAGDGVRFAIEDWLGAGAILDGLAGAGLSAEAEVCREGFRAVRDRLEALLLACESGRELAERGWIEDVRFAARNDLLDVAPRLSDGRFDP